MNDPFDHDADTTPPQPQAPVAQPQVYAPLHAPGLRCHHCQSTLEGAMLGGSCPQCGAPITASFYPSQQSAGMAISSMILGIVSVITGPTAFCCVCITGLSAICGVLAIIFYFPAVNAVKQGAAPPGSQNMALSGLICGIIGAALSIGAIVFAFFRF